MSESKEKKLSYYSLQLCKEAKNSLGYIKNATVAKQLKFAITQYMNIYKKLGLEEKDE